MLSLDIYVNETTRHADVILPAPGPLEKPHYDLALYQLAARNVANYSPPCFERHGTRRSGRRSLRLAGDRRRPGPGRRRRRARRLVIATLVARELGRPHSRVAGRDPAEILAELEPRRGPERMLDLHAARPAPTATASATTRTGLTLDVLEQSPHGVDLGPLQPRIPRCCAPPSGKIELAPEPIVADLPRLRGRHARAARTATWS